MDRRLPGGGTGNMRVDGFQYGRYCGNSNFQLSDPAPAPINDIDLACKIHVDCYDSTPDNPD
ncbi:hypothetical protein ACHAW5_000699 [Stephanodiscus triporus]|uniref:Uncharacterized protein n=1 Tax=Stephanodiscus triporus TaxID=2934178 RepID=A0ABD3P2W6_9STRA